ncbi:hypothetical protein TIFTF001_024100 [Ficus carica]|uniref:Large ribosomal subunit protein eL20 domain-containing protein n=1 Tax=Ficus carica TaxID=3494 RepID=A0AA88AFZ0_FICCA|nr:hypothetical protein TIFTF001_024100 [Ficus carica]
MVTFRFHQYQVVGRGLPSETDEHPKIYRMKLWATNEVRAKSKFWYFLRKLKKVKKSNGQVLAINEIFEKNPTKIDNYGIWLRYQSRTGYHNMYKEFRDTTLNGAVEQMYNEMASRHRVRFPCIQIIKTATVPAKLCKRESTKQFHNSKIKFPLVFKKNPSSPAAYADIPRNRTKLDLCDRRISSKESGRIPSTNAKCCAKPISALQFMSTNYQTSKQEIWSGFIKINMEVVLQRDTMWFLTLGPTSMEPPCGAPQLLLERNRQLCKPEITILFCP